MMSMKVKWADVVVGKVTTRHTSDSAFVDEITVDQHTMGLVVQMKDGTILSHVGCSYVLCMEDVAEIITPKIEIAS